MQAHTHADTHAHTARSCHLRPPSCASPFCSSSSSSTFTMYSTKAHTHTYLKILPLAASFLRFPFLLLLLLLHRIQTLKEQTPAALLRTALFKSSQVALVSLHIHAHKRLHKPYLHPPSYTRTHIHTRTHMHTNTHTHTHTHTHTPIMLHSRSLMLDDCLETL